MIYPPNPVPAFKLEGKLEGKAWQSSGRAWQMGKSQSVARSCQLLPSVFSRLSSTNLRSLCQIRQKRSQRTLCITMSCSFLHSKMNHFSPPASTQIAQTVLLKVWTLVVSRCFEDNVDKFLTTDVTKPKASKVPFSWHTNRHTESIESIVFFLATGSPFLEQEVGAPHLEGGCRIHSQSQKERRTSGKEWNSGKGLVSSERPIEGISTPVGDAWCFVQALSSETAPWQQDQKVCGGLDRCWSDRSKEDCMRFVQSQMVSAYMQFSWNGIRSSSALWSLALWRKTWATSFNATRYPQWHPKCIKFVSTLSLQPTPKWSWLSLRSVPGQEVSYCQSLILDKVGHRQKSS